MAIIDENKLAKYLKLNYNVLFIGNHGVGKTTVIKKVFEDNGLRWKYFSASTLDPWVDFVGIPKPMVKDGKDVLKLIRPEYIENDEVDALFFDELNRASEKTINAIMELIQFKSINGHKLNNLKVIWAAINPPDEEETYSVNTLDPAHLDRFHVHVEVPFKVDKAYFLKEHPLNGPAFIQWWDELPADIKFKVSPRRLDYTAHAYENGCQMNDFVPKESNIKKLQDLLKSNKMVSNIKAGLTNPEIAATIYSDFNAVNFIVNSVAKDDELCKQFYTTYKDHFSKELIASIIDDIKASETKAASDFNAILDLVSKRSCEELVLEFNELTTEISENNMKECFARACEDKVRKSHVKTLAIAVAKFLNTKRTSTLSKHMYVDGKYVLSGTNKFSKLSYFFKLVADNSSKSNGLLTKNLIDTINHRVYRLGLTTSTKTF